MRTLVLFKGTIKRHLIETYRYGFELLSSFVVFYLLFVLVFFGAQALLNGGAGSGGTLSEIVVGYLVWITAILAYSATSQEVVQEATAGTLEQLALSPAGLARVLTARFIGAFVAYLWVLGALLVLMMATSGRWLNLDWVTVLPLYLLTIAGIFGLGLALGGLAVVFKRVQSLLQIVQFLFVIVIAVPMDRVPVLKYLPLAWGNDLLRRTLVDGASLATLPAADLAFLAGNTLGWLVIGYGVFGVLERVARDRALLGQY